MDLDDYLSKLRSDMDSRLAGMGAKSSMQSTQPQQAPAPDTPSVKASPEAIQMAEEVRVPYEDLSNEDPLEPHWGIIFTDSNFLSQKYHCSQQEVYDLFNQFIQATYDQQMYWYFLDAVNYYDRIGQQPTWEDYNDMISDCIQQNNLQPGPDLHVLIVGGADVIPIPWVTDPYEYGNGSLPSDMCYCFEGSYIPDLIDGGDENIEVDFARNNVSRLPLEDGEMQTDIQSDLGAYFNLSGMYSGGIPVGNVVMISNSDWIPASTTMSQHLPLLYSVDDPDLIRNGMYISPRLLTSDEETMSIYQQSLSQADMLMFNLHGADAPAYSGFYSVDEAFNPGLLSYSRARVFNTVACFGARYSGYERNESMLLSSLYGGGILLYTGSLIPVPMYYNAENPEANEARELLLNPGTGSEVFMRLYPLYQFKGMTAGRAILQAKCDYFNMCRHVESDGFSLSTILMFSLYGNPMLHVRKREHVVESALQNDAMPPAPVKALHRPIQRTLTRRVMSKDAEQQQSILQQIRGAVDSNLEAIRHIVEQNVYQALGLPPRMLNSIDQFERPNADGSFTSGYSFNYHNPETAISADTHAEVDSKGNIKRIYTTK